MKDKYNINKEHDVEDDKNQEVDCQVNTVIIEPDIFEIKR